MRYIVTYVDYEQIEKFTIMDDDCGAPLKVLLERWFGNLDALQASNVTIYPIDKELKCIVDKSLRIE